MAATNDDDDGRALNRGGGDDRSVKFRGNDDTPPPQSHRLRLVTERGNDEWEFLPEAKPAGQWIEKGERVLSKF